MAPDTVVWEEAMGQAWVWVWAAWGLWALLVSFHSSTMHALQPVSLLVCRLSVTVNLNVY